MFDVPTELNVLSAGTYIITAIADIFISVSSVATQRQIWHSDAQLVLVLLHILNTPFLYRWTYILPTNFVIHVEQSTGYVCVCLNSNFEWNDRWSRYLARWFISTLSGSVSKVGAIGQSSWSHDMTIATAMDSVVRKVNLYTAGGLWRIRLNYDGNVFWLSTLCIGASRKQCAKVVNTTSSKRFLVRNVCWLLIMVYTCEDWTAQHQCNHNRILFRRPNLYYVKKREATVNILRLKQHILYSVFSLLYSSLKCSKWHLVTRNHTVLLANFSRIPEWNEPFFIWSSASAHHRTLTGIHFPSHTRQEAELAWMAVTYRGGMYARPETVTNPNPSINRPIVQRLQGSNSRPLNHTSDALTTRLQSHHSVRIEVLWTCCVDCRDIGHRKVLISWVDNFHVGVRHVWRLRSMVPGRRGRRQSYSCDHLHSSSAARRFWPKLRSSGCRTSNCFLK